VLATQNPLEHEGTYPLPEAQLDRFLLQVNVDYPDGDAERQMLLSTTGLDDTKAENVIDAAQLQSAQKLIRRLPVGESVVEAILKLVRAGRPGSADDPEMAKAIAWGPGPRASQALMLTCRARALLQGRVSPSIDDVIALAPAVLRHRMALNFAARADGMTVEDIIDRLCEGIA
jgi:MoxR-like ATPase